MNFKRFGFGLLLGGLVLIPGAARAGGLSVEIWTDRGADAVYQPGDAMQIRTRTSEDAYLLVYEIDSEGQINVLYPLRGMNPRVEGRHTYVLPPEDENLQLVVQAPVGEGYLVAIASQRPFGPLPWYLRPYNPQAEDLGYYGAPKEEEGVSDSGRIVGDPFTAMERIRRRVLQDPDNPDGFASAYVNYYVHEQVRYPRYLCYDCHRPGHWAWWDGFDPYYTTCSVFDFRVNWGWYWGPGCWFGSVPYFVYVYRYDCPPRFRRPGRNWYSSWDGWRTWRGLWGNSLTRYKSPPPPGYRPPSKFDDPNGWRTGGQRPPGFLSRDVIKRGTIRERLPLGRNREVSGGDQGGSRAPQSRPGAPQGEGPRKQVERPQPARPPANEGGRGVNQRPKPQERPMPRVQPRDEQPSRKGKDSPNIQKRDEPRPKKGDESPRIQKRDEPSPKKGDQGARIERRRGSSRSGRYADRGGGGGRGRGRGRR